MSKYTKWKIIQNNPDERITDIKISKETDIVVYSQDNLHIKEHKNIVQLISAAPELLEACKENLRLNSDGKCTHKYIQYNCGLCTQLKQAIAKAEEVI